MAELAVVVPTRGRPQRLQALLASLRAQEGVDLELVVVLDGGDRDTEAVVSRAAAEWGDAMHVLRHAAPRGPAAARNTGWRAVESAVVAFLDDDCRAAPGWGAAMKAAHEQSGGAPVQGRTEPDPAEAHLHDAFSRSLAVSGPDPWFPACNVALKRDLLERLEGFDESFRRPAGEDTDLAWRARALGCEPRFAPAALAYHAVVRFGVAGRVRDALRWGDIPRVVTRHPALRQAAGFRVFWRPSHARLALALVGASAARPTRGLSLALAVPWLALRRPVHGSWAGTIAAAPGHLAVDATEIAVLAAGSVRARTLVL